MHNCENIVPSVYFPPSSITVGFFWIFSVMYFFLEFFFYVFFWVFGGIFIIFFDESRFHYIEY